MNYEYFDEILRAHGIQDEPAFDKVLVEIAPLPAQYRDTLGLYYPDPDHAVQVEPGTIWIPPNADEETVLHELGHRRGHFYHNDLSEKTAEAYRLSHPPRLPARLEAVPENNTVRNLLIAAGLIAVSIAVFKPLIHRKY